MKRVVWLALVILVGALAACRGDDIAPPDVFVDYDARAVPTDTGPIDAGGVGTDAGDAGDP